MKRMIVASAATGFLALTLAAAPALAVYPPNPGGNSSQSSTTVPSGGGVDFTFGTSTPFTPGATVTITSLCTAPDGSTFAGPSTTATADANGKVNVRLTFTQPGTCVVTATGKGAVPGGIVTATATVTITGKGGGGGTGGGGTAGGDALATTGASNNTLTIAAVGGGLLLAGVGAVAVARRREHSN